MKYLKNYKDIILRLSDLILTTNFMRKLIEITCIFLLAGNYYF